MLSRHRDPTPFPRDPFPVAFHPRRAPPAPGPGPARDPGGIGSGMRPCAAKEEIPMRSIVLAGLVVAALTPLRAQEPDASKLKEADAAFQAQKFAESIPL